MMKPVPDQRNDKPHVAIVGAGWAGLAAAVALTQRGARVTVLESARQLGGRARRVDWDGIPLDNGQHLLIGAYRETLALLATLGVDANYVLQRLPMRVEVPGRLSLRLPKLPAPLHTAIGLLGAKGPTFGEKIAAARFIRALEACAFQLGEDISVSDLLERHRQRGVLREHLWESLCLAALNTLPAEASAQVFANVLRDTLCAERAATDFLLPKVDLGRLLPDAAENYLTAHGAAIHSGCRVTGVRPEGNAWIVTAKSGAEQKEHRFDHVILATGAQHVAALLPADARLDGLRTTLTGFAFEPIATAYLRYPASARLPSPILALNQAPAQWVIDRGQLAHADDCHFSGLFAHVLSAHGAWEALDDQALVAALDARMRDTLPTTRDLPAPLQHLVIREKRATFRCTPGLLRPPTATALPGLCLAGDYVASDYPGTLEAAVRSGRAAAAMGMIQA